MMNYWNALLPNLIGSLLANLVVGGLLYWVITRRLNADLELETTLLRQVEAQYRQVGYLEFLRDEVNRLVELSQGGLAIEAYHPETDEPYDFSSYQWEILLTTGQIPELLDNELLFRLIRFYKVVKFIQKKSEDRERLNFRPRGSEKEAKRLASLQGRLTKEINRAMADMVETGKGLPEQIEKDIRRARAKAKRIEGQLKLTQKRSLR